MKLMATYHETAHNAVLYVLKQLGTCDKHKLFKILYFADIKHLVNYGRSILETDSYVKMDYGPVPSKVYDEIKYTNVSEKVRKEGINLIPLCDPDMDYLSHSEIECLDESIKENKDLSFPELKIKSHGFAWSNANDYISIKDMALEGGANESVISYIREHMELSYAGW